MRRRIAILGSTGSIGVNTLDVASRLSASAGDGGFAVIGLSADSNIELLSRQVRKFHPKIISVRDESLARRIKGLVPSKTAVVFGIDGLKEIVARRDVDEVVFAIAGSGCLLPLAEAIRNKKDIALANKEAMVIAGSILIRMAKDEDVRIVPIDSEHSAIFQCIDGERRYLSRIYLTGSGGPLLNVPRKRFDRLGKNFILNHPRWAMGKKISVDSATMMNKGLEIIEAQHLFGIDQARIEVLIHPEAIIHSMVEFLDGVIFAQLGVPDMRTPIQYALTYPARFKRIAKRLDFHEFDNLSFRRPDTKRFPCLEIARAAAKLGGTYPAAMSSSDEEAVRNYLDGRIKFSGIPAVIEKVLERHKNIARPTLDDILKVDEWAKEEARRICSR